MSVLATPYAYNLFEWAVVESGLEYWVVDLVLGLCATAGFAAAMAILILSPMDGRGWLLGTMASFYVASFCVGMLLSRNLGLVSWGFSRVFITPGHARVCKAALYASASARYAMHTLVQGVTAETLRGVRRMLNNASFELRLAYNDYKWDAESLGFRIPESVRSLFETACCDLHTFGGFLDDDEHEWVEDFRPTRPVLLLDYTAWLSATAPRGEREAMERVIANALG